MNSMSTTPHRHLDLAVIGNCEVSALVDYQGRIVWMCLPRPDGDPVFSALLTEQQGAASSGVFAIDLQGMSRSEQHYVRNSAVVETLLYDDRGGALKITDFAPRFRSRGRNFRPMMLIRVVEAMAGRPLLKLRLRPTSGYGAQAACGRPGSNHVSFSSEGLAFRITSDASITSLTGERSIVLNQPLSFIIGVDETLDEAPGALALRFLQETRNYWQEWVRTLALPFDWQEAVIRSAITLKLCTFEDTGAVLAALTTSIPESANSGRNWDYRYCWLRDAYFVVQALNRLGATRTMEGYLHFIDHIVAQSSVGALRPVYPILAEGALPERRVATLGGFLGMGPVRVGNEAAEQTQHDVYGAIILAASQLFFDHRLVNPGGEQLFSQLESLGERAAAIYEQPDAGPWEFRGRESVHTFSATMSWAGCDRLARIAERLGMDKRAGHWRARAAVMRERILSRAWNARIGAFAGTLGGADLDASVLLLPELGLVAAVDERFVSTVDTIGRELVIGDMLYRYRHADDFGTPATAFTICAFWYVNALAAIGRLEDAREHFTRLLARRNPLGLLSEDIDPATGSLWGNYPQTYSMVGIINSALRLSRSWEEAL